MDTPPAPDVPVPTPLRFWRRFITPGDFLSAISTEESVAAGKINLWAMIETVLAIGVFWWIALTWHTFFLLYSSLFIAPLLMLRSDASIQLGAKWFEEGVWPTQWPIGKLHQTARRRSLRPYRIGILFFLFILVAPLLSFIIYDISISQTGWQLFISIAILCLMATLISILVYFLFDSAVELSMMGAPSVFLKTNDWFVNINKRWFATLFIITVDFIYLIYSISYINVTISMVLLFIYEFYYVFGFIFSILFYSILVRFIAILFRCREGFLRVPHNILTLITVTSPGHLPELVPGLRKDHRFQLLQIISNSSYWLFPNKSANLSFKLQSILVGVLSLLVIPLWFMPAFVYRFNIKSTMWLWWILLIIGGSPNLSGGVAALEIDIHKKRLSKISFWSSTLSLITFFAIHVSLPYLENQHSDAPFIPMVAIAKSIFQAIDWPALSIFGVLGGLSAVLTIVVWFWADNIVKDAAIPERTDHVSAQIIKLGHVNKFKAGIGAMTIALIMLYIALYANSLYQYWPISRFFSDTLHLVYGRYASAVIWPAQ